MKTKNNITYKKGALPTNTLIHLYKSILYPRLIEEKMLILLRQGKISKWFSGIGQEAISVGVTEALQKEDYIFTMHRNLGVFTSREVPLSRLVAQWQGKVTGFTKGRDRSFHFGAKDYGIVGMISHLGPQLSLASGVALAKKIKKEPLISVAFTGEGGTSQGEFHEALNVASVWQLPVIFIIENNGYGLSTPINEQYYCEQLAQRASGYGMDAIRIDGNNILEVYQTIKNIADEIRHNPKPWLVECETFRMRGHEEASGTKYVPPKLLEDWAKKDPVINFKSFLEEEKMITNTELIAIEDDLKQQIHSQVELGFQSEDPNPSITEELNDVYAPTVQSSIIPPANGKSSTKRMIDAIAEGLYLAMIKHPDLILMGQDIAEYGGVFKATEGLIHEFGKNRVRNTPLCESAIVGIAMGLSICKMKAMVEMQFADFVSVGFNQIVNNLAKSHYRWGQNADVVIRMPTGGGVGAGPFHSQSNEAWFTHTPGLKIVYPSNPKDAKGLLLASFEDPNPILFFEHKALYRSISDLIPEEYYTTEIGKAVEVSQGNEVGIITYGMGVHWALTSIKELNIDATILDLRTLLPLDLEAIKNVAEKTNKIIVLHEDTLFGGIGGEISAYLSEHCFELLDGPIIRVGGLDTPIPFAKTLENQFLPKERLKEALINLTQY
ncbi:MAG: alpha-ketoacid dehydrogenase subunit alpha/beta [Saprospiraceae bacterium]|jgi:2-oxoisovalerate dehydrogenase E1 component